MADPLFNVCLVNDVELFQCIQRAQKELNNLCRDRKTFRMCIPPKPSDTDILIGDGLRAGKELLRRLQDMQQIVDSQGSKS